MKVVIFQQTVVEKIDIHIQKYEFLKKVNFKHKKVKNSKS
jgi:hypothetical protein